MDLPNSDSDDPMNRKPSALPHPRRMESDSGATLETVLLLRREVCELRATVTQLTQEMELLVAVARVCPICSGWREAKLSKHRGCKHHSPLSHTGYSQSSFISEKTSVSSASSNQSCLAEGYDDRPLFGWNPDPFANFNPNLMPLSTSPFCHNPDPFTAPIPLRKKQYRNGRKTITKRMRGKPPVASKGDNTWKLYLESMNMDQCAENMTTLNKSKRISAKKKVNRQKPVVGTRQQLRKMKSRKVSLESHRVPTLDSRSSPKSTSEEEF
jgi:hypothetical protein